MEGVLIAIIVVLSLLCIVVFCMYTDKSSQVKDLKSEQNNLKVAYQKGITKSQEGLLEENLRLKEANSQLLSEKNNIIDVIRSKDVLIDNLKNENKKIKENIIELSQESDEELSNENFLLSSELNSKDKIISLKKEEIIKLNDEIQKISDENSVLKERIEQYKEYVIELNNDIQEFEAAYVAIGGDLRDIYEDYE